MADCLAAHAEASAHVRLTGMLAPSPAVELAAAVNACVALADVPHHPPSDAVQRAACISRRLMQALAAGESAGWSLDELRDAVAPARAGHA